MMDDTTEAGMLCQCGHPALWHLHEDIADQQCCIQGCPCVEFIRGPEDRVVSVDP